MADHTGMLVEPAASLGDVLRAINRTGSGIALVAGPERSLLGTITDGDIRRGLLAGLDLETTADDLLRSKVEGAPPLTAQLGTPPDELLHLMNTSEVRHIPLLDDEGRVAGIALLSELARVYELPLRAVVMAGGPGTRMKPLTDGLPKSMLPVGNRPLLEIILDRLRESGIRQVSLTTHHHANQIVAHFGDGTEFGLDINYVNEDEPLGTAGSLSAFGDSTEPVLVINGDILTHVDFRALHDFHRETGADMTVAVRRYEVEVPFGVVQTDGDRILGISEKPVLSNLVNAGIYILAPEVCRLVPSGERHEMTDLIERLLANDKHVVAFPIHEYWLDVGQMATYEQAKRDVGTSV